MTRNIALFGALFFLFIATGYLQSWSVTLSILNLCLISAVMALGVNIQWGYAGLFNAGIMGFAAVGGTAALLISHPPIQGAVAAGGGGMLAALAILLAAFAGVVGVRRFAPRALRRPLVLIVLLASFPIAARAFSGAKEAIEAFEPASSGFLGGLGLPIILSWPIGGAAAAAVAYIIGKVSLGMRADYLAIATLGISEILVSFFKNEDWLTRGVKNATGLPSPFPRSQNLQNKGWVQDIAAWVNSDRLAQMSDAQMNAALKLHSAEVASLIVKLGFAGLFAAVLLFLVLLSELSLKSPWGRMIRAIRDNETAAAAMGKNVGARHMQILVLGSAVVGIAGAMLVTYEGQFTPNSYLPLRYTFLIWVMVIVGGSGNNAGSIFGAFLIWLVWIQAEPLGFWIVDMATGWMSQDSDIRAQLLAQSQHLRLLIMGSILLLVLRFNPGGLIPERPHNRGK